MIVDGQCHTVQHFPPLFPPSVTLLAFNLIFCVPLVLSKRSRKIFKALNRKNRLVSFCLFEGNWSWFFTTLITMNIWTPPVKKFSFFISYLKIKRRGHWEHEEPLSLRRVPVSSLVNLDKLKRNRSHCKLLYSLSSGLFLC